MREVSNSTTLSVHQAAKLIRKSTRWVQMRAQEGYIPRSSHGQYPLVGLVRGAIEYFEDQREHQNRDHVALRTSELRAREIELRVQSRLANLIPREDADEEFDIFVKIVAFHMREMAKLMAREFKCDVDPVALVEASIVRIEAVAHEAKQNLRSGDIGQHSYL